MTKRIKLNQLKKYDVTQKIVEVLANAESRSILFSTLKKCKTVSDISSEMRIPVSTVYKKIGTLKSLSLIKETKMIDDTNGKYYYTYKSQVSKAVITINKPEVMLELYPQN